MCSPVFYTAHKSEVQIQYKLLLFVPMTTNRLPRTLFFFSATIGGLTSEP